MTALKPLYRALCQSSDSELARAFAAGYAPALGKLCGWEYYGYNTLALTVPLGIRKFKKAFFARTKGRAKAGGYNCKVRPTRLDGPWENGGPGGAYQGFYEVLPGAAGRAVAAHDNALLLDYGQSGNSLFEGSFLRDFLVQVDAAEPDVFLGRAYAAIGPLTVPVSYFVLQRANRLTQPASLLAAQ
jgi:hypothetical protein